MLSKKDQLYFILAVVGAFLFLLAGAWTSPTFAEEQSYIEAIVTFASLLFVFSIVVIVASIGFRSFALYLALFVAMAISLYGVKAGVFVVVATYLVWGFVFAIQLLLVHSQMEGARRWFRERYTFRTFDYEYKAFYPMLWIFYFFFEYLPHLVTREPVVRFRPDRIREEMRAILRPR
ncbi:hypothetical protein [Nitratifractor sp.]